MSIEHVRSKVTAGRDYLSQAPASSAKELWDSIDGRALATALEGVLRVLEAQQTTVEKIVAVAGRVSRAANRAEVSYNLATVGSTNTDALDMITGAQTVTTHAGRQLASAHHLASALNTMTGAIHNLATTAAEAYQTALTEGTAAATTAAAAQPEAIASANAYLSMLDNRR